jgi:long-chain acyl-CoA synthetase
MKVPDPPSYSSTAPPQSAVRRRRPHQDAWGGATSEPSTICELFQNAGDESDRAVAFRRDDGSVALSWAEYAAAVQAAANGLTAAGLNRGDTLACWLTNRVEFHVADAAALHLGAVGFSIYSTYTVEQAVHVIADAGCRVLVTESAFLERALAVRDRDECPLEMIIVVDVDVEVPGTIRWEELLAAEAPEGLDFEARWQAVRPDDLATLIYTSGTTGPPKGVELTHANVIAQLNALRRRLDYPLGARVVSYLPMAHVAERINAHYLAMAISADVTPVADGRTLSKCLPRVRPHFFFSPPRTWEKLRAAALAQLGADVGNGEQVSDEARVEVLKQVGFDQLRTAIVGAAPCPVQVIEFWKNLGIELVEVYGLSESTGVATLGGNQAAATGTVGRPLEGVEVRLGDGDEVLIRGPVVMRGYRNLPDATADAIDPDGWLHTGDVGAIDDDGNLRIVDRIKELIINAAGKNMSPANIEAQLKSSSPLIGQAVAIGDGRPYNVALITIDAEAKRTLASAGELTDLEPTSVVRDPSVIAQIQAGVDRANQALSRVEQIKRFVVLSQDWEPGGDELTPTMKLKRREINAKYAAQIEAIYRG